MKMSSYVTMIFNPPNISRVQHRSHVWRVSSSDRVIVFIESSISRVRNILLSLLSLHLSTISLLPSGSVSSLSLSPPFPQLRPALAFFRRFEGRPHERIKPIHTLNLSTASHPATRYTWRIKRCYVNMEKVVDSCMRRAWISLSCPTSRETDAFVSLASLDPLSRIVLWYACVTFAYLFPTRLFVSNERRSWISIRRTKRTYVAISQS